MLATIRRFVHEHDDVMDVYSTVCQALCENELARLKRYVDQPGRARFSTWLVAVVRNVTIDWLRKRDGRRRRTVPEGLSALQRDVFTAVFLEGRSHLEAFESLATRDPNLTFRAFLRALRETYRQKGPSFGEEFRRPPVPLPDDVPDPAADTTEASDTAAHITDALQGLPPAHRAALELFVIEGMPAADVARTVGWANAKAVYNNVYRALASLRERLARGGIGRDHLP